MTSFLLSTAYRQQMNRAAVVEHQRAAGPALYDALAEVLALYRAGHIGATSPMLADVAIENAEAAIRQADNPVNNRGGPHRP